MCCCEKQQSALRDGKNDSNESFHRPSNVSVLELLPSLTSNMFISSISARVGALSRMRGRDDGRGPGSDTDKSMHEVDLTLQGQVWARQGREPNAEERETKNTVREQISQKHWDQSQTRQDQQSASALASTSHPEFHHIANNIILKWACIQPCSSITGVAVKSISSPARKIGWSNLCSLHKHNYAPWWKMLKCKKKIATQTQYLVLQLGQEEQLPYVSYYDMLLEKNNNKKSVLKLS